MYRLKILPNNAKFSPMTKFTPIQLLYPPNPYTADPYLICLSFLFILIIALIAVITLVDLIAWNILIILKIWIVLN